MENLFYSLGYNYKELQKYYKSDTLEKHLPYNKYSEEEIDIIKGYFASRR